MNMQGIDKCSIYRELWMFIWCIYSMGRSTWIYLCGGLLDPNCSASFQRAMHYNDVIMREMASQITSFTIVYSSVYSGADKRKHQSSASLVTDEFPTQKASNAENVSIWWRHHDQRQCSVYRDCKSGRHILWHCTSSLCCWWHGIKFDTD